MNKKKKKRCSSRTSYARSKRNIKNKVKSKKMETYPYNVIILIAP